ncbi:site-specific DNA-methyltransferase [bacterium]|nr:site-specific DNA-methyltransferase [bacterium]
MLRKERSTSPPPDEIKRRLTLERRRLKRAQANLPICKVVRGDSLKVLCKWPDYCIDAIVTGPPYGIQFLGEKWDNDVPSEELWRQLHRVLKAGGRLLVLSATRTWHRMATRIESAGFHVEDEIVWIYGQGFPKHSSKLKPAHDPIIVARKGPVSDLNIDAARIREPRLGSQSKDRWPANVVFSHTPGCTDEKCQSGCAVDLLNSQAKYLSTSKSRSADLNNVSRFFYCTRASTRERNLGCENLEKKRKATFMDTLPSNRNSEAREMANFHPTVQPVDLMRWLIRLVCKPGDLVLDPFFGSGTTGVAANCEGVRWIGIEMDVNYCRIARARTRMRKRLAR